MATYYVYILTNISRTVLYTGVTNNLTQRIEQHTESIGNEISFTGKYGVTKLIYYEEYGIIDDAIAREKQIKGWRRAKKEALINKINPRWKFILDEEQ